MHYLEHSPVYLTRTEVTSDGLRAWVDPRLMVPDLVSMDRMGAIKELVDPMHETGWVDDSLGFLQAVLEREDLQSTVVDSGVAFPHARSRSVRRLGAAVGLSREGINLGSVAEPRVVHLICLFAIPTHGIRIVSALSFGDDAPLRRPGLESGPRGQFDAGSDV